MKQPPIESSRPPCLAILHPEAQQGGFVLMVGKILAAWKNTHRRFLQRQNLQLQENFYASLRFAAHTRNDNLRPKFLVFMGCGAYGVSIAPLGPLSPGRAGGHAGPGRPR
jgi:hypothetical protein